MMLFCIEKTSRMNPSEMQGYGVSDKGMWHIKSDQWVSPDKRGISAYLWKKLCLLDFDSCLIERVRLSSMLICYYCQLQLSLIDQTASRVQ